MENKPPIPPARQRFYRVERRFCSNRRAHDFIRDLMRAHSQ